MKKLALFVLLVTLPALGQGGALSGTALKCDSTLIAAGATVRVCTSAATGTPCAPTASIYSDSTLVTPLANPATADSCGNFPAIYAAQGNYKVQISGTGLTTYTYTLSVPSGAHNILSASHSDVTVGSVSRGDGFFVIGAGLTWQRLAHPATTGGYFKWNGTDIVASSLAASGTGDCAASNKFVVTLNADAAPTCATVGTSSVSAGVTTKTQNLVLFDPVAGDSGRIQFEFPSNVTITRVYCNVKAATNAVIQLNKRTEAAPDVGGTDVLTASLTCLTGGASTTSFASAAVTAHIPIALTISSITGVPDTLRVAVEYTTDAAQ